MRISDWSSDVCSSDLVWFRDAIRLVERHGIGWSWWPLKKIGFNNPLEIAPNPGWKKIIDYWLRGGPRPSAAEADQTLMRLATNDQIGRASGRDRVCKYV